jgi:chorismate synthase
MNHFGRRLCVSTFGESHGAGIGCVIEGMPANTPLHVKSIQKWLDRRRPGKSPYATARKESDNVQILSGVFEGKTTGTPIALFIPNENQKSSDYSNIKDLFRPGHADLTYWKKYGIRDYRGGGRSSARETAARVAAAGVASALLDELHIQVQSGIYSIGEVQGRKLDFSFAKKSEIFSLDPDFEPLQKEAILEAKNSHDSIGGCAFVKITNTPAGLGEPLYDKLDARLAEAMMGINGVKAVEIGQGVKASRLKGSQNNDLMDENGFLTNNSGGILGGMSSSAPIELKIHFKPTPSIFHEQSTQNIHGQKVTYKLKGRHDPCIAVRGSVVAEAMAVLVIADMLLLNMGSTLEHVKKLYM